MSTTEKSGRFSEPKHTQRPVKSRPGKGSKAVAEGGFTDEERAAMRDIVQERKVAARRGPHATKEQGEHDVLAAIAKMPEPDRGMAERLHGIIKSSAPKLRPKTWYGMPAYADDNGKVVCFFQAAQKFKTRYATLGFSDKATLDDGNLWPTAFAIKKLTPGEEARIMALVKEASA